MLVQCEGRFWRRREPIRCVLAVDATLSALTLLVASLRKKPVNRNKGIGRHGEVDEFKQRSVAESQSVTAQ